MKTYGNMITVENMNDYFVALLIEYTWAHVWEISAKDKSGVMIYKAQIRPNVIERLEFNAELGVVQRISSSNSLMFPPGEYNSSYCIEAKLLSTESIMKTGRSLGEDKKMRYAYSIYLDKLCKRIMSESYCAKADLLKQQLSGEKIFGLRYSKLKEWLQQRYQVVS